MYLAWNESLSARARDAETSLIRRGPFDAVDDQHFSRTARGVEPEPELLLQGCKEGWQIAVGVRGYFGWRERQLEVPGSGQSSPIDHDALRLPGEKTLELRHRIAAGGQRGSAYL